MTPHATRSMFILACAALLLAACGGTPEPTSAPPPPALPATSAAPAPAALTPTVKFTLVKGGGTNTLVFVGVGGAIDKHDDVARRSAVELANPKALREQRTLGVRTIQPRYPNGVSHSRPAGCIPLAWRCDCVTPSA